MRPLFLYVAVVLAMTHVAGCGSPAGTPADAFSRQAAAVAVPLDPGDAALSPEAGRLLSEAVGSARVVAVGESRHDTAEQIRIKHQIFRHLVAENDVRMLILEESHAHAQALDRYVATGEGDLPAVMNGLAGWYLWDVDEFTAVIRGIAEENRTRTPRERIRVSGMDITAPAQGVRQALAYLEAMGSSAGMTADRLRLDLHRGDFWPAIWSAHSSLSSDERTALADAYSALVAAFDALAAADPELAAAPDFARCRMEARIGQLGNELFSTEDRAEGGVVRERGMFEVVRFILEHEAPGLKAVIWTHNLHAARSPFRMPDFSDGTHVPVGRLLDAEYGDRYLAIGAAFGSGSFGADLPPGPREFAPMAAESMDGALARALPSGALVDLRTVGGDARAATWLRQEREWRAQEISSYLVPAEAFDLVFFVPAVSRAQPTPLALRRFRSMGG